MSRAAALFEAIAECAGDIEAVRTLARLGVRLATADIESRGLSTTPSAVRARERRKRTSSAQLTLPVAISSTAVATAVASDGTDLPSPKDPDPKLIFRKDQDRAHAHRVEHDPEQPPLWLFDDARALRPDLPEATLRNMWRRFVNGTTTRPGRKWHRSEDDARTHFKTWLRREKNEPIAPPQPAQETTRVAAEASPASETRARPVERRTVATGEVEPMLTIDMRRSIAKAQLREARRSREDFARSPEQRSMSA